LFQTSSKTHRKVWQLPGPDTVLLLVWRALSANFEWLLFRYSDRYRRRLAMRRLSEFR
jgi:hypothetical protein